METNNQTNDLQKDILTIYGKKFGAFSYRRGGNRGGGIILLLL